MNEQPSNPRTGHDRLYTPGLVVIGDSLVSGWGLLAGEAYPARLQRLLEQHVAGGWRVIAAGVPGDTAVQGCLRWERDVVPAHPRLVIIAFGLNDGALSRTPSDAWREGWWLASRWHLGRLYGRWGRHLLSSQPAAEGRERTRPRVFGQALGCMVRGARRLGSRVCLLTPTPVLRETIGERQWQAYARYQAMVLDVARRCRVTGIDLWQPDGHAPLAEALVAGDGLHLTVEGHRWLADLLWRQLVDKGLLCTTG